MTETIAATEVLKSKQNFARFVELHSGQIIDDLLKDYPNRTIQTIVPQLTPNSEGLVDALKQFKDMKKGYLFWFIANEKEDLFLTAQTLNNMFTNGCGIFIVKLILNEDKIDFECILKPELVIKKKREVNTNTPSKQLQKTYWEAYIDLCDASEHPEMQIIDAQPRHYQNISIGKTGVQILQTVNTSKKYVASEIAINNNKSLFEKLLDYKEVIEQEVGELIWDSKETNKSAKIRKVFEIDINNPENHKNAIIEHINMAAQLTEVAKKYIK